MADQKELCRVIVTAALNKFKTEKAFEGDEIKSDDVRVENPPKPEMGDIGAPMFLFAKSFHMAPPAIAQGVAKIIIDAAASGKELGGVKPNELGTFAAVE